MRNKWKDVDKNIVVKNNYVLPKSAVGSIEEPSLAVGSLANSSWAEGGLSVRL